MPREREDLFRLSNTTSKETYCAKSCDLDLCSFLPVFIPLVINF